MKRILFRGIYAAGSDVYHTIELDSRQAVLSRNDVGWRIETESGRSVLQPQRAH